MARLIDADRVIERVRMFEKMTGMRLDKVHDFISSAPTVAETAVIDASVIVDHVALMTPFCEQYVKDMMARKIAEELVNRIEIRSFASDPRSMMKDFRSRVVILTDAKMDEVGE